MEVQCSIPSLGATLMNNIEVVTVWSSQLISCLGLREREELKEIINQIGLLSAKAQCLRNPVTNYERMMRLHGDHRLYLCTCSAPGKVGAVVVKGMLKVGAKNLFIRRQDGSIHEMSPVCVLDFYVHQSLQRYDRPSAKFLSLLAKYHGLSKHVPQPNQFVVFDAYFEDPPNRPASPRTRKKTCDPRLCNTPLRTLEWRQQRTTEDAKLGNTFFYRSRHQHQECGFKEAPVI